MSYGWQINCHDDNYSILSQKAVAMNVCMVSGDFSYPPYGGIAAHIYELSKSLVALGHTVHIVKPSYGAHPDSVREIDGIAMHSIFALKKISGASFGHLIAKTSNYISDLLRTEHIDVLHWHEFKYSSLATKFARSVRVPRIFTNHSSTYLRLCESASGLLLLRFLLSHADGVISPSEELRDKTLLAWNNGGCNFYIPNGVDTRKFDQNIAVDESLRGRFGLESADLVVLCPRRLDPKNGIKYLIESASSVIRTIPKARFLIVGDGPERDNLSSMVADRGLEGSVIMPGGVTNDRMPSIYALAHIVALPSLREATSIAGLEAMACGKPLVGANVGGIPAIIQDGETGFIVPPKNSVALAESIKRLLLDTQLRLTMGSNARKKVEREFSWAIIAQKTFDAYKTMINLGDPG